ncbi:hypothetical protein EDD70_2842 [Hydrogenoanaerobacterium saccharovorans]|uniref:Lipocalin-like domain-containing protein n=1 Tax=Hydrogenoanaerobacterium saccharovorans TaxID=474960 RepID=A0A1H8E2A2_9FIRM|nr:hypothetical protein [Hydrogenoanaerobacterium saccharovorans]RPF42099.1 hypothetical protein EDD70_2842 [Hydrogenoanaerobacterium saccharovorans]SEN13602.1 hypothetical protein SAMN05216180_2858 [Hydrogenoanaerobacterium saccharovorans]
MLKKIILLIFLLTFNIICTGCNSAEHNDILIENQWKMEFISDLDGNILVTNLEQTNLAEDVRDMRLSFSKDGTVTLKDLTNGEDLSGTYTSEKLDNSIKLEVDFEDKDNILGTCGLREYGNGEKLYSIVLNSEDKILSFIQTKQSE